MWSWRCLFPWTKAPQNRIVFHYIFFLMTMSNDTHFFRWIILGIPIYRYTLSFLSKPEQASTSRKQTTRLESNNAPYSLYTRFHHFFEGGNSYKFIIEPIVWPLGSIGFAYGQNLGTPRIGWLILWKIINLPFGDGLPMVYQYINMVVLGDGL